MRTFVQGCSRVPSRLCPSHAGESVLYVDYSVHKQQSTRWIALDEPRAKLKARPVRLKLNKRFTQSAGTQPCGHSQTGQSGGWQHSPEQAGVLRTPVSHSQTTLQPLH